MNILKIATAASMLALTTSLASAAALSPEKTGIDDTTGISAIGIDISGVPATSDAVRQFIAGLAPDTQRGVLGGCQSVVSFPAGVAPNVVQFCESAVGTAPNQPMVMGFAPEEPAVQSPALIQQPAY